jgi:hypothetical protein
MANTECDCTELEVAVYDGGRVVGRRRISPTRWHDCDWIRQRNRLIPIAERRADLAVARLVDVKARRYHEAWIRAFSEAMDALVDERLRDFPQ